jgi:putative DNA primase/helicase
MTAEVIARSLGAAARSGEWWRCRCPVHQSRGPSLALRDGDSRLLVKCWAGCGARDVLTELERLGLLDDNCPAPVSVEDIERQRERDLADRRRRIANALDLFFNESRPAAGTLVERYLNSRGIYIPIPSAVRASSGWLWHRESGERRPAMLCLVEHAEQGPVAVHCTYLAIDGSCKATIDPNKKFFGPVKGGAVRLGQPQPNEWFVVGEGIESTASAMQLWGLPTGWAALSESGLRNLVLPPETQQIVIACDNDENGTGQAAARDAAWLWAEEGRTVRVMVPPQPDTDFNDVLNGGYY